MEMTASKKSGAPTVSLRAGTRALAVALKDTNLHVRAEAAKALGVSALHDWPSIKCIQPMYNLVKRQAEVEILPLALSENIGVISYNPLGGGLLTGKYGKKIEPSQSRLGRDKNYGKRYGDDWMLDAAMNYVAFARDGQRQR